MLLEGYLIIVNRLCRGALIDHLVLSAEDSKTRAENTVTREGLSIIATVTQRTYETKGWEEVIGFESLPL